MMTSLIRILQDFYARNIFERIIIYLFIAEFIVTLVFEFGLHQWSFKQSQHKQWIFYGLLALDYLICLPRLLRVQFTFNAMSALAFVFLIMVAHGLYIGLLFGNPAFVILNDTVPLLMIALNIIRMQSLQETARPIDMRFLFKNCTILAFGASLLSLLAISMGVLSDTSVAATPVYFPLLLAALIFLRPLPLKTLAMAIVIVALALTELNRTTMLFLIITAAGYFGYTALQRPARALIMAVIAIIIGAVSFSALPEDSKAYQRIVALKNVDLSQRTGSIGERQAEWDAIQQKLADTGQTAEWFGLGFGGLYEVQFTHEYLTDYGHAHFAWAWFNLRFGESGYFYMIILIAALGYNSMVNIRHAQSTREPTPLFVALLCVMGLIYCGTHVNSVFLLSGIHFINLRPCVKPAVRQQQVERIPQPVAV